METLNHFLGEKEFYEIASSQYKDILVRVCLGLLKTSANEYEMMSTDPEQFVTLALDSCDKQQSRIVKTQAAKLIETICDNIDGAVSFVTLFCCQSIYLALDANKTHINSDFS